MPRTPAQREKDRIRRAKYVAANRAKVRAQDKAYRSKESTKAKRRAAPVDIEKRRAYNRVQYLKHREKRLTERKAYVAANREAVAASVHENYMANREQRCAYAKAWKAEHPTYNRDLLRANPERGRDYVKTRRARKHNAPVNDLSAAQWVEIQAAQDHCCYYCGKRCKGPLTQDHIVPLTQGGSHTLHNVVGACQSCNSSKKVGPPPVPVQPLLLTIAPARKKKAS